MSIPLSIAASVRHSLPPPQSATVRTVLAPRIHRAFSKHPSFHRCLHQNHSGGSCESSPIAQASESAPESPANDVVRTEPRPLLQLVQLLAVSQGVSAVTCASSIAAEASQTAAAAVGAAAESLGDTSGLPAYVPGTVEVGWEIWVGAAAGVIPFAIGAYEFGKRILIQQRCLECAGTGLVQRGQYKRKCRECGGFFPWVSWRQFFSATAQPGNGGAMRAPRGQTSIFYKVPPKPVPGQQPVKQASEKVESGRNPSASIGSELED